jgi:type II secretory pathway component GspD/PulD (secretin)
VPLLKDIPLLGALFRDKQSEKSLGETIFFITPRIVDERSVLQSDIAVKEGSMEYIKRSQAQLNAGSADGTSNLPPKPTSTLEEDE